MSSKYIIDTEVSNKTFLEDEIMYRDFERCTFTNCDLSQCNYLGTSFIDCDFINCNFTEAKVNYVSLRGVQFTSCNFTEVNFSMCDPLLFRISFDDCILDYAKLYTLKLKGTIFNNCSLIATDFMKTDVTGAVFSNCNMHQAVLIDTIANKADFTSSYNFTIDPEQNKLKKAKFSVEGLKGLLTKHDLIVK
ncbi:MAG: hypothetical protein BM557_09065 [Flavobacterium sp. MedPE-SWcel]|uniref:pentapeptide repeat-containing protein n=1 Tax=uncultured Flavobacterium sp. TaxID=165435 RepID=UPI000920DED3|nr:pentapeptide repeat-containing protein [uncultured Flavobacterium sp.]OIQ16891.1 MAG: hypothetical protein BM557_09065 [Flavobacterium sp. MedPE-SWcel]